MEEDHGGRKKGDGYGDEGQGQGESGRGAASGRKCSVLSQLVRFRLVATVHRQSTFLFPLSPNAYRPGIHWYGPDAAAAQPMAWNA